MSARLHCLSIGALFVAALMLTGCFGSSDSTSGSDSASADLGSDSGGWSDVAESDYSRGSFDDAGAPDASADGALGADAGAQPTGNTNVNLSGASDIGFFRRLLDDNIVPSPDDITAEGFFAEHHTPLPEPDCGERVCLQAMYGVMGNLIDGSNCTMMQLGLNSPIVADPDNRPPLTLAVVIDTSGSMRAAGKLGFVRQGLELLIDSMQDDDQLAIITYDSEADVAYEMGAVGGQRHILREIAQGLTSQGGTNLYAGLELGYESVLDSYDSGRQNRVILLSDGIPSQGITSPDLIADMSRSYNSDGVGLTTIGVGTDFNASLMQTLAELGDGNFYFVESAGAVEEVFIDEISYFTVPVAFDLTLDVTAGEHYRFQDAYGSTFWESDDSSGHLEVPSVFLAHRVSHSDVTGGGGRRGGGSALLVELMPEPDISGGDDLSSALIATVDVSFREPGSDEIVTDTVNLTYPYAPWEMLSIGVWEAPDDAVIHKSFIMLNIYVALRGACEMFHGGAPGEAIGVLLGLIAAVEDYNEEIQDTDMEFDLELMRQLIEVIESNSSVEPEEPEIDEDPWPAD